MPTDRDEHERLAKLGMYRKQVRDITRKMLEGKDRGRISYSLGVKEHTLVSKVTNGRFTMAEFLMLAQLCGYDFIFSDESKIIVDELIG